MQKYKVEEEEQSLKQYSVTFLEDNFLPIFVLQNEDNICSPYEDVWALKPVMSSDTLKWKS